MSSLPSTASETMERSSPSWFEECLSVPLPPEGGSIELGGHAFVMRGGILRSSRLLSTNQTQTAEAFGYKWYRRETFERAEHLAQVRAWLVQRYGDVTNEKWFTEHGRTPILLDAGCGAAMSALELFGPVLKRIRYVGVDVSAAVEIAAERFAKRGLTAGFLQTDLMAIPLPPDSVDLIFAEGVLHHTDSPQEALNALTALLKPGGRFLFYVYRKKGPIREFTDDYIREKLQGLEPEAAWNAILPLTRLGKMLGDLNIEIDVPEPIEVLGIPAGRINLQRFIYWHVAKAFYRPDYTLDEMQHINFDWYTPKNAHRQTPDEVRAWCATAHLVIEREQVEESGITIIARKMN